MQSWGKDPYTEVYYPVDLDKTVYETDAQNNVRLVTLRSDSGQQIVVPTSYIKNCPLVGGVPYNVIALAVKLGAIADEIPLDSLISKIEDLVKDNIGLEPEVKVIKLSETKLVPQQEHESLEQARQNLITSNTTLTADVNQLVNENNSLREQLTVLQEYIQENL
ncbi:MAG: hypothetical protein M0P09_00665 [Acholeplasmataceae bacterium]|nr:hypothetical protein [Acholeplasmataceae bacterium]